jgi:hypothetical protein
MKNLICLLFAMVAISINSVSLNAQCITCSGYNLVNNTNCDVWVDYEFVDSGCQVPTLPCIGTYVYCPANQSTLLGTGACCNFSTIFDVNITVVDIDFMGNSAGQGQAVAGTCHCNPNASDGGTPASGNCLSWSITWGSTAATVN